MKSAVPGASRTLIFTPFHSIGAIASETEMPLRCSSGSWSETVLPSSTVPMRVMPPDGEEHRLEQRRLARPSVADQQDVADVLRVVGLQRGSFRMCTSRSRGHGRGWHPIELLRSRPSDGALPATAPGTALTRAALLSRRALAVGAGWFIVVGELARAGVFAGAGAALLLFGGHRANHGEGGPVDRMLTELLDRAMGRGGVWARSRGSRRARRPMWRSERSSRSARASCPRTSGLVVLRSAIPSRRVTSRAVCGTRS